MRLDVVHDITEPEKLGIEPPRSINCKHRVLRADIVAGKTRVSVKTKKPRGKAILRGGAGNGHAGGRSPR